MAPNNAPISIPTGDVTMANGATDSQAWDGGRSPGRGGVDLPRRSSRSRSPGRGNSDDRKCVSTLYPFTSLTFNDTSSRDGGGQNPGNNLHVSGLSSRVDTRDLEAAFAKIGRVSESSCVHST